MYDTKYLQKLHQSPELQDVEYGLCKKDPYHFMTHWAWTLDQHDEKNPIKLFPEKDYIKIVARIWLKNKLLLIPKSRLMMTTWMIVCLYLWDTQFHKGKLTFFQSKREDDADDLVQRAKFIWDHEPKFLKRYFEDGLWNELRANPQVAAGKSISCKLCFPSIYSEIRGIPQGGDIVRMHTVSGFFADEMAFQPEAMAAYTAVKPSLSSGGRFTGVSTAEDNSFFQSLIFDKENK